MFATLLAHQTYRTLANFWGKFRYLLVHGSIVSRVGASTKSGAVQMAGPSGYRALYRPLFATPRTVRPLPRVFGPNPLKGALGLKTGGGHAAPRIPYGMRAARAPSRAVGP
ncbi:conserved hypothetical protein [Burkholderia sp. 8Y]|nr:conserved hypothetical protein [Burkholderia sp. 8Y]